MALFCSFIMGVGTGFLDGQVISLLGDIYADQASQAFTVFKICQHASQGVTFAYAGYLNLYWQLGIVIAVGFVSAIGFTKMDVTYRRKKKNAEMIKGAPDKSDEESVQSSTLSTKD